ncbi:hypothetical protein FJT64_023508 [Amphibalanus amphitrite]|uniref:Uncharacterized protein n=1 Tax=Amphibalanus amphitrite TaxID=1232801 RepID=A0A6A4WAB8_AMPAM|nr:hypothetical protein FJT64_023508 [Amphibalanus amphitrite]
MEPARPPEQPKSRLRRRSSILKAPASPEEMTEDLTSRRSSRRVSFADRFRVQEFFCDEVTMGGWAEAYDKEAQITDSSGDATAAARGAPLLGVLQNSNASASMELTAAREAFDTFERPAAGSIDTLLDRLGAVFPDASALDCHSALQALKFDPTAQSLDTFIVQLRGLVTAVPLVRGLRAQLEAYRRAREASERETQAVVEAALARMRC